MSDDENEGGLRPEVIARLQELDLEVEKIRQNYLGMRKTFEELPKHLKDDPRTSEGLELCALRMKEAVEAVFAQQHEIMHFESMRPMMAKA